jgi:hypothetical protein
VDIPAETSVFPPVGGTGATYTSDLPDSSDVKDIERPSGEKRASAY